MKKVLFIYYHYPPVMGGTGGLEFVRLLPELGWEPVVISAAESVKYEKDYGLLGRVPPGIEIHRVGHHEPSPEWQYARNKFRINYDFPDYYKKWYSPALREARKVIRNQEIDLIFSSSPPYTSALIALKLKKESKIPWVAEWRDLWSGNEFLNTSYERTLIRPLRQSLKSRIIAAEKEILKTADRTVVLHWYHRKQLSKRYGVDESNIDIVTNGYSESDFDGLKTNSIYPDKLTIVFLGSFYPDYREIIINFSKAVSEVAGDAEIVFIGQGAAAMQDINTPNLTRILHMARKKALGFAAGSDFLFVVMPQYARWIPGKVFEYLRVGKPILALVPKDGDAARLVEEAKTGFVLSYEPEEMKKQLNDIFVRWRHGEFKDFRPDAEYVSQFEHRNLSKKLVDIFNAAAAQK